MTGNNETLGTVPTLFVAAVGIAVLWGALELSPVARYIPVVVLSCLAPLLLLLFGKFARGRREAPSVDPAEAKAICWLLLMPVLTWLLGIVLAAPVFVGVYLRHVGGQPWRPVVLITTGVTAVLALLWVGLMDHELQGPLTRILH